MNALFTVLTVLIIIAAILLVIVVLLQNGKGEGMASNFVAGNQTFGVRQTADILEKITWGLVIAIVVLSVVSTFTTGNANTEIDVFDKIENTADQQPDFGAAPIELENPAAEATETAE